jgi:hypothetical protein
MEVMRTGAVSRQWQGQKRVVGLYLLRKKSIDCAWVQVDGEVN